MLFSICLEMEGVRLQENSLSDNACLFFSFSPFLCLIRQNGRGESASEKFTQEEKERLIYTAGVRL